MYDYTFWGVNTLSGMDNMALEEYFLRKSAADKSAHIRFYDFAKDTVVLGYGQATDALKKWDSSFTVARRASGGSHVHVGKNTLAYSVIIPRDGSFSNHQDFRIYYAEKVAAALENIGIPALTTDHNASTIMQDNKVLASHAVTWGVKSALLHGLVMITPYEMERVLERIHLAARTIGSKTYSEVDALRQIPTVTRILHELKPNATIEQKEKFCKQLISDAILREIASNSFTPQALDDGTLARARILQEQKYATEAWIRQRDPTFTPEEIEEMPGEQLDGPLKKNLGYCLYIQVPDKDFKNMADPHE
jgi:lipoate-protein ligase A